VLLDEGTIAVRVRELAAQISADYADAEGLVLIGVLKGAFVFLADLARRLTVPHSVDFIALSSYNRGAASTGAVRLIMDTRTSVTGRHVLVVEDIVDTGYTLNYLLSTFRARQPASLRACVLLSKPERRQVEVPVDYLGFEIPDVWVVGYGLDYADRFRTLPYIGALKREVYERRSKGAEEQGSRGAEEQGSRGAEEQGSRGAEEQGRPLLVCVLKGAFMFLADLTRHLEMRHAVDFMEISSYGTATRSSGVVRILLDLEQNIEGRHVLIVEDIVDSGRTLDYITRNLRTRNPASLRVCTLLSKPSRREIDVPLDFVGFEVPDEFVMGYGLDFAEEYRNLPFIGVLKDEVYESMTNDK
jgi:hypoxanthine phosphoribosyltransferase